jgi:hypothetical protein
MPATFQAHPWESQKTEPIVTVQFETGMLWPHGAASEIGGGNKDVLEDGLHPVLAVGSKADRNVHTLTGIVVTVNDDASLAQLCLGKEMAVIQYVTNILTYAQGAAATWAANWNIGMPVYVDDSAELAEGVTLSLSPLNSAGSQNPLAGWIIPCQDEYSNFYVGGANIASAYPKAANAGATVEAQLCILLR